MFVFVNIFGENVCSNIDILAVWCSVPGYSIKADNDYVSHVLLSLRRQETIALN